MKRFRFRARTRKGVLRTGLVESVTQNAGVQVLRGQDLIVIELKDQACTFTAVGPFAPSSTSKVTS